MPPTESVPLAVRRIAADDAADLMTEAGMPVPGSVQNPSQGAPYDRPQEIDNSLPTVSSDDAFALEGLTMEVPNPDRQSLEVRRERLLVTLRRAQIGRDQARAWLTAAEITPTPSIGLDLPLRKRLQEVEHGLYQVLNDGSWLYEPPVISQDRATMLVPILKQAVKEGINAKFRDLAVANNVEDAERAKAENDKLGELALTIQARFNAAIINYDYGGFPLTQNEVLGHFDSWVQDEKARTGGPVPMRIPFHTNEDDDAAAMYRMRVVETYASPQMLNRELNNAPQQALDTLQRAITDITNARFDALPDLDNATNQFKTAAAKTLAFSAALQDIGTVVEDQFPGTTPEALRKELATADPDLQFEAVWQMQRVVTILQAQRVTNLADVQMLALQYELNGMSFTKTVPLVIETVPGRQEKLSVRVVPGTNNNVVDNGVVYTYSWLRKPLGSTEFKPYGFGQNNGSRADEINLPLNDIASQYKVVVTRVSKRQKSGFYVSPVVSVVIRAECQRCNETFMVDGQRAFGECMWRKHPVNAALITELKNSNVTGQAKWLAESMSSVKAVFDDSVIDVITGQPVVSGQQLIDIGIRGRKAVRSEYFTYKAVLRNINNRLLTGYTAVYGPSAATYVEEQLYTTNAVPKRTSSALLLGAISTAIIAPPTSAIVAAEIALSTDYGMGEGGNTLVGDALVGMRDSKASDAFYQATGLATIDPTEAIFSAMQDATQQARTLDDVPVYAVVFAILHAPAGRALRKAAVASSELRFFRELEQRLGVFADLHQAYGTYSEEAVNWMVSTGQMPSNVVVLGRRGPSDMRLGGMDPALEASMARASAIHLASMSASAISSSRAWRYLGVGGIGAGTMLRNASDMFIDVTGEERLWSRIEKASQRNAHLGREYVREARQPSPSQWQAMATAMHSPLGVPLAYWDLVDGSPQGIAAAAQAVGQSVRRTSNGMVDWRGTHSATNSQPDLYAIKYKDGAAVQTRGSEPIGKQGNFARMHEDIDKAVARYPANRTDAAKTAMLKQVSEYNALAFFGPAALGESRKRTFLSSV